MQYLVGTLPFLCTATLGFFMWAAVGFPQEINVYIIISLCKHSLRCLHQNANNGCISVLS